MEQQVISAVIKDRKAYETFTRIGSVDSFSPLGRACLGAVSEYFDNDPDARSASLELIEGRLLRDITNPKHEKPLRDYLRGLSGDVSVVNVEAELKAIHRKSVGSKLSLALANGVSSEEEIQKLWAERQKSETVLTVSADSLVDVLNTDDLTSEVTENEQFIKLWPRALNDRLDGGALRGHHVLVFARPEAGKTTAACNFAAGFVHQQLSVCYWCNEEPVADIRDRFRGRILKQGKQWIRANRSEAADRLQNTRLGKFVIGEGTSFQGLRSALIRPASNAFDVVIIDQLRNMRVKSDSRTAELEAAGIEARSIAKEFQVLVVSITQAGDSASGKVFLEMSDIDSSKTGLPSSADLIVGIGCDAAMKANNLLGFSLCKNKMSGLHDRFHCSVNFQTGVID